MVSIIRKHQKNFANQAAMRRRGMTSSKFWPEIIRKASARSEKAASVPKSKFYRDALEPYLNTRVKILFDSWEFEPQRTETSRDGNEWILAKDGLLIFAQGVPLPEHRPFGHMHVRVDKTWREFVNPDPGSKLMVDGVLYNYINSRSLRNIGLWAVTVTPYTRDYQPKTRRGTT